MTVKNHWPPAEFGCAGAGHRELSRPVGEARRPRRGSCSRGRRCWSSPPPWMISMLVVGRGRSGVVVVAVAGEGDEVVDRARHVGGVEVDDDVAAVGHERGGVGRGRVDAQLRRVVERACTGSVDLLRRAGAGAVGERLRAPSACRRAVVASARRSSPAAVVGVAASSSSSPRRRTPRRGTARAPAPPTTASTPITTRRVSLRRCSSFACCWYFSWRFACCRSRFSVPTRAEGYRRVTPAIVAATRERRAADGDRQRSLRSAAWRSCACSRRPARPPARGATTCPGRRSATC